MKVLSAKKVAVYGFLTGLAIVFGYVEFLLPLNFIAPGVKLGVANCVILLLILTKNYKAAILINLARIVLSALLFSGVFSLMFSLSGGVISTVLMILISKSRKNGVIGISVLGGTVHNLVQLTVAGLTVGSGVWFYTPYLLLAGIFAGVAVGILVWMILKKINNNSAMKWL